MQKAGCSGRCAAVLTQAVLRPAQTCLVLVRGGQAALWIRLQNPGEFTHLTQRELIAHVLVQDGSSAFCLGDKPSTTQSLQNSEKEEKGRLTKDNFMARPGGADIRPLTIS